MEKYKIPYYAGFRMCNDYEKPQDIYQGHDRGKVANDIFNAMKGYFKCLDPIRINYEESTSNGYQNQEENKAVNSTNNNNQHIKSEVSDLLPCGGTEHLKIWRKFFKNYTMQ
ncbi:hypothetical protein H8356DRAFT_992238 [Neocallimastix lanati (nom. inval.)]|nr:hypothetical protein H8356DRAFT_992238 [Neocallimastix sp. JGI-2020a]